MRRRREHGAPDLRPRGGLESDAMPLKIVNAFFRRGGMAQQCAEGPAMHHATPRVIRRLEFKRIEICAPRARDQYSTPRCAFTP